jgi:hypothetical protein
LSMRPLRSRAMADPLRVTFNATPAAKSVTSAFDFRGLCPWQRRKKTLI